MHTIIRRRAAAGLVALSLAVTAGCAQSGNAAESSSGGKGLSTITVGQLPIVDAAGFYFAAQNGYFKAEKINAKPDFSSSAGAMVTNLVNGTDQFVLGETAILVEAYAKGLPVRIIGVASKTTHDAAKDTGTVLVAKGSRIKTAADLNGKTIAVGALKGGGELSLRAALDKEGAKSNTIKFIEMPLSDMTAALAKGRVDAISTISPFDQASLAEGATRLLSPGAVAVPGGMQVAIATTAGFQAKHRDVVKGFLAAMAKGTAYAAAHSAQVRQDLPKISPVPPALIAKMQLPVFDASDPQAALTLWTNLMEKYKFVSKPVDVPKLMS